MGKTDEEQFPVPPHMMVIQKDLYQELTSIRPTLQWFAKQMEAKLKENDHKTGWSQIPCFRLLCRLREETMELSDQLLMNNMNYHRPPEDLDMIIQEAADVANFAMMIADNCRARKTAEEARR